MNSVKKILIAFAAVSVIGGVLGLVVDHFHLPQAIASTGIGVVIGVGVALCILSFAPKGTKWS